MFKRIGFLNKFGLVSVCAKFQLPNMSRSGRKVWGGGWWVGGLAVATVSNLNPSYIELL